jgi:hypothetical protein
MVTDRLKVPARVLADAWLAVVACSGCSTGPSDRPSLVGTYDVEITTDIAVADDSDTRTVGVFIVASQSDAGDLAGTYTLALVGADAPTGLEPSSGILSGTAADAVVTFTIQRAGFTPVLLIGTRSAEGNVSGAWGTGDGETFVRSGAFVLTRR